MLCTTAVVEEPAKHAATLEDSRLALPSTPRCPLTDIDAAHLRPWPRIEKLERSPSSTSRQSAPLTQAASTLIGPDKVIGDIVLGYVQADLGVG